METLRLNKTAYKKFEFITGAGFRYEFPKQLPSLEWVGAVCDFLDEIDNVSNSLLVDKTTKRGHPESYYTCPHCNKNYTLKFLDNYCCKCGGKIHWNK